MQFRIANQYADKSPLSAVLQRLGDNVIPYLSVGPLNEAMTKIPDIPDPVRGGPSPVADRTEL